MFAKELDSLSLASDIADELFPNITGAMYGRDQTFIATLRALLHSRMIPEDRVRMYYTSKRATARDTERFGKKGSKYLKYCFEGLTLSQTRHLPEFFMSTVFAQLPRKI